MNKCRFYPTKSCENCGRSMNERTGEYYCENCGRRETICGSIIYPGRRLSRWRREPLGVTPPKWRGC